MALTAKAALREPAGVLCREIAAKDRVSGDATAIYGSTPLKSAPHCRELRGSSVVG